MKIMYHKIADHDFLGIVTILDYETAVKECLSELVLCVQDYSQRKIIVDLALKVGISKYRFVEYKVTDDGKIAINSSRYITPSSEITQIANGIIGKRKELLSNSMLSKATQRALLHS